MESLRPGFQLVAQVVGLIFVCWFPGQLGVEDDSDNKKFLDDGAQICFLWQWVAEKNTNYLETPMTLILIGKGLVLKGWASKIEVIWALGR